VRRVIQFELKIFILHLQILTRTSQTTTVSPGRGVDAGPAAISAVMVATGLFARRARFRSTQPR
jgi:hypothetical protein